jgi:hypothetical protein
MHGFQGIAIGGRGTPVAIVITVQCTGLSSLNLDLREKTLSSVLLPMEFRGSIEGSLIDLVLPQLCNERPPHSTGGG